MYTESSRIPLKVRYSDMLLLCRRTFPHPSHTSPTAVVLLGVRTSCHALQGTRNNRVWSVHWLRLSRRISQRDTSVRGAQLKTDGLTLGIDNSHPFPTRTLKRGRASGPKLCGLAVRTSCLGVATLLLLFWRVRLNHGHLPHFSAQDNPASFHPHLSTRTLTYLYLLAFNGWLLVAPVTLCYDWQMGSIPLVESLSDPRNMVTVAFLLTMAGLCLTALGRPSVINGGILWEEGGSGRGGNARRRMEREERGREAGGKGGSGRKGKRRKSRERREDRIGRDLIV